MMCLHALSILDMRLPVQSKLLVAPKAASVSHVLQPRARSDGSPLKATSLQPHSALSHRRSCWPNPSRHIFCSPLIRPALPFLCSSTYFTDPISQKQHLSRHYINKFFSVAPRAHRSMTWERMLPVTEARYRNSLRML